jgi:hypothetical protein
MALRVDQVQRRSTARRDPRAEPDPSEEESDRESGIPASSQRAPERVSRPVDVAESPRSSRTSISVITSVDPRLVDVDPLLAAGEWRKILDLLGPPEAIERLPPTLGLIYAVALRESAGDASATPANELAIRSMAAIYGIPTGSAAALVLAKRLLRQNPAAWRTKPAPPAKFSVLIIVIALALGAGVGWWLSMGSLHLF